MFPALFRLIQQTGNHAKDQDINDNYTDYTMFQDCEEWQILLRESIGRIILDSCEELNRRAELD